MLHRKTPGAPDYAKGAPHVRVGGIGGAKVPRRLGGVRPTRMWGDWNAE